LLDLRSERRQSGTHRVRHRSHGADTRYRPRPSWTTGPTRLSAQLLHQRGPLRRYPALDRVELHQLPWGELEPTPKVDDRRDAEGTLGEPLPEHRRTRPSFGTPQRCARLDRRAAPLTPTRPDGLRGERGCGADEQRRAEEEASGEGSGGCGHQ
jgi:hypothetical protein